VGPHQTELTVEGMEVEIRPFDLLLHRPRRGGACVDVLVLIRREVSAVPSTPEKLTIRAVGRGLEAGEPLPSRGRPARRKFRLRIGF
jgi:hypothetical protein